jgi:HK97 family phage portal protein
MNIFENLRNLFSGKTQAVTRPSVWQGEQAAANLWNVPDMQAQDNQLSLYETLSWVQIAVSTVAQYAAAVPLQVHTTMGEDEEDITNHPFEMLLKRPNPLQSRFELLEATYSSYKLIGNAFWWLSKSSENEPPTEIWTIPANRMRPVPDKNLYLKGYIYTSDFGQEVPLELWEIVHFKHYHPRDPFNGLSPAQAIGIDAHADIKAAEWNAKLWGQNNGRLPGFITFQDNYDDEQWAQMLAQIKDAGTKRNLVAVRGVKQGGIQLILNTLSQKDMEFLQSRTFTKEEIFGMFSPGLSSVLSVNATEANAKTGKATMMEMAVYPMLSMMAEKITNDILPSYGENLRAEFDDVRSTDRVLEIQETAEYAKYHTVDEVRKKYYNDTALVGNPAGVLLPAQVGGASIPVEPMAPEPMVPTPLTVQPSEELQPVADMDSEPVKLERARWMRRSIKEFKAGKAADASFKSDIIPAAELTRIQRELTACKSTSDIRQVFGEFDQADSIRMLALEIREARKALA